MCGINLVPYVAPIAMCDTERKFITMVPINFHLEAKVLKQICTVNLLVHSHFLDSEESELLSAAANIIMGQSSAVSHCDIHIYHGYTQSWMCCRIHAIEVV